MSKDNKKGAPAGALRTAYDIRRAGDVYEVVAVDYGDGMSDERVVFKSESATIAASNFNAHTKKSAYEVLTGLPGPGSL